jgi:hypothetical protein
MSIKFNLLCLIGAFGIYTNAYAVITTGTCDGQRISYATDDAIVNTSSLNFVNMPGMARTINIPGTTTTCAAINFSTMARVEAFPDGIYVRATRDGITCDPGSVSLDGGPDEQRNTYAANFICRGVTPGNHTFRIQWSSAEGASVPSQSRAMIIHHR